MKKIAFFDTKPYDRVWFERLNAELSEPFELVWYESRLRPETACLAEGADAVCAFVNDDISASVVNLLADYGISILAMRCAGFSNVDLDAACGKLTVVRVPAYSPDSIAEHAAALMLAVDRRIHRAYARTRDYNFNIAGLEGTVLRGKCAGIVGMGRIGVQFAKLCQAFGMRVLAYDPYPTAMDGVNFVPLAELLSQSDVISLHCPLTKETYHLIDAAALQTVKRGALLINTSRGALVDSNALIDALNDGTLRGAGLDVYEEEGDIFYEDLSDTVDRDEQLSILVAKPNVLLTAHQAFLTEEALESIAATTLKSLTAFFHGEHTDCEVCAADRKRSI
ncbi:MAG: 2-hydroxyacid dehydrogenase [Ruminococcaceae bacterium]|nr:2-hydroxyacid dehydrogenase [Oscillospiraceae bacterium]